MHKEAKRPTLWRWMTAGALVAVVSLAGLDTVQAQEGSRTGRFFSRIFRRPGRHQP
jgi:hypothetical protein